MSEAPTTHRLDGKGWALALITLVASVGIAGCATDGESDEAEPSQTLFERVSYEQSGVGFINGIQETLQVNILSFEYLYNGGGVAVGDVDGDGLADLFFTATQLPNRLYRNLGGFRFEDITEQAGVAGRDSSMTTGATFADVDGDGDLDLYVCQTGKPEWPFDRRNLLYLNDGTGAFTEQAEAWGIASTNYSNQATFFDYDHDGDLDLYLLNHPYNFKAGNEVILGQTDLDPATSDQFFRNDGSRFTEVSEQAGIRNEAFGLSATALDYDNDGWLDVYVANDYVQPDYLYQNEGDGTFTSVGPEALAHTSHFGMGADAADINNDGDLDLIVLDMMAEDARRQRLLGSVMNYERFTLQQEVGMGAQVMRNMLQVNTGDGDFAEVGQLAGVSTTDWSWGPLLADFDLDGFRDLFVANGYRRDVTNLDYMQFTIDSLRRAGGGRVNVSNIYEYLDEVPSEPIPNYAYRNRGDLSFEDVSRQWGVAEPSFSNGAAYADLDNDGDLDLIVNDIDAHARLYRNRADVLMPERHWLRVAFEGMDGNPFGIGARVTVETDAGQQVGENVMTRGFYSSVEPALYFGLGPDSTATVSVRWLDGTVQRLEGVAANQQLTLRHTDAADAPTTSSPAAPLFAEVTGIGLDFVHDEDPFVDFKRDGLIPHKHSREGPALATADVNGDGLGDLYIGGAVGQAGVLYRQTNSGRFTPLDGPWQEDAAQEDVRALFFDADGNGTSDLLVASGGNHIAGTGEDAVAAYAARLYYGDGTGGFTKAPADALPATPYPTGAVDAADIDSDGDLDLFIGSRLASGRYPEAPRSYLFINDGQGRFTDATAEQAPDLMALGLVSGARWADLDGDDRPELVMVGEWMAPSIWQADAAGRYARVTSPALDNLTGWWNAVTATDLDGDGDLDLLAGNLGLNSRIQATPEQPVRVHAKDYDNNGSLDPVLSLYYPDGRAYPIHRRESLMKQLPYLQQRFPRYGRYAASSLDEVFGDELEGALVREATTFASMWFENDGQGEFTPHWLPVEAQVAPLHVLDAHDADGDGNQDLLLAGNDRGAAVESGPYDALRGLVLRQTDAQWEPLSPQSSGLRLPGDVTGMVWVETAGVPLLVAAVSDGAPRVFRRAE